MKKLYEVGVKECSICEYYLKCTECALPQQCQCMKAEIERLKVELNYAMAVNKPNDAKRVTFETATRSEIKAEAIKEFAKRLKDRLFYECGDINYSETCDTRRLIDNLVKEMVGEG